MPDHKQQLDRDTESPIKVYHQKRLFTVPCCILGPFAFIVGIIYTILSPFVFISNAPEKWIFLFMTITSTILCCYITYFCFTAWRARLTIYEWGILYIGWEQAGLLLVRRCRYAIPWADIQQGWIALYDNFYLEFVHDGEQKRLLISPPFEHQRQLAEDLDQRVNAIKREDAY